MTEEHYEYRNHLLKLVILGFFQPTLKNTVSIMFRLVMVTVDFCDAINERMLTHTMKYYTIH